MKDIFKTAYKFLSKFYCWFYIFPILGAVAAFLYTFFHNPSLDLLGDVVGPIGIFSALMFSVIFIVVEHYLKRKEDYATENDEDINYLERYHDFSKNTVAAISFSVLLAGLIIIYVFVFQHIQSGSQWFVSVKNAAFCFLVLKYLAIIVIVVLQMYTMLIEDIDKE